MKIALATDHGGFEVKEKIKAYLTEQGHEVEDFGTHSLERCDYPDFAIPATRSVADGTNDRGVLICTNGEGMVVLANKIKGIRAGLLYNDQSASHAVIHGDCNIACLGGGQFPLETLTHFLDLFFAAEFLGGRYQERLDMVMALD